MTITTKFNLGDEVFVQFGNIFARRRIDMITATVRPIQDNIKEHFPNDDHFLHIEYLVYSEDFDEHTSKNETEVFATLDEALDDLRKRSIEDIFK